MSKYEYLGPGPRSPLVMSNGQLARGQDGLTVGWTDSAGNALVESDLLSRSNTVNLCAFPYGLVPNDSSSTARAHNTAMLQAAIDDVPDDGNAGGRVLLFPRGSFYFASTTIYIRRRVRIHGGGHWNGTVLKFPAGLAKALYGVFYDTLVPGGGNGSLSEISDLTIVSEGKTSDAVGIYLNCRVDLHRVEVRGFKGDGVQLEAGYNVPISGKNSNANFCRFSDVRVAMCDGYGLNNLGTTDTSGLVLDNFDGSDNLLGDVRDYCFLGNSYIGCGFNTASDVMGSGGAQVEASHPSAFSVFVGCYSEGLSDPDNLPKVYEPSVVVGGTFSSSCWSRPENSSIIISPTGCRNLKGKHPTSGDDIVSYGLGRYIGGSNTFCPMGFQGRYDSGISGFIRSEDLSSWPKGWYGWTENVNPYEVSFAVSSSASGFGVGEFYLPNGTYLGVATIGSYNNPMHGVWLGARTAKPEADSGSLGNDIREFWNEGDCIFAKSPAPGAPLMWRCTEPGAFASNVPAWAASSSYLAGALVEAGGRVYRVKAVAASTSGTSGSSAPSWPAAGVGNTVTDGSGNTQITWEDVGSNDPKFAVALYNDSESVGLTPQNTTKFGTGKRITRTSEFSVTTSSGSAGQVLDDGDTHDGEDYTIPEGAVTRIFWQVEAKERGQAKGFVCEVSAKFLREGGTVVQLGADVITLDCVGDSFAGLGDADIYTVINGTQVQLVYDPPGAVTNTDIGVTRQQSERLEGAP